MPKDHRHWEPPPVTPRLPQREAPRPRESDDSRLPWQRRVAEVKTKREPVRVSVRNTWGAEWHRMLRGEGWTVEMAADRRFLLESTVRPLELRPGVLEASVGGASERPHRVQIRVTPLTESDRTRLARQVTDDHQEESVASDLKRGEIPVALVDAADRHQIPLLPRRVSLLVTTCTCGGARVPCDHVVAVHLVVAKRLYSEPQLLLQFRGIDPIAFGALMERIRAESAPENAPKIARGDPYAAVDGPEPDWKLIAGQPSPRPPLPSPEGWRSPESFDALVRRLLEPSRKLL